MKNSTRAIAFFMAILLFTVVIGCQSDGPLNVQSTYGTTGEPEFLTLPPNLSLQKFVADTALITPELGGQLNLSFKYKYTASTGRVKELSVRMTLKFPRDAVTDSVVASLRLDDQRLRSTVDITFNPHGSVFLKPAILDAEVKGMDVTNLNPHDSFWLYYDDNGTWVKMVAKKIEFDFNKGLLKCEHGELPHFSRYAFGR